MMLVKVIHSKRGDILDDDKLWNQFNTAIIEEVSPITYNSWIKNLKLLSRDDNKLYIEIPMEIYETTLKPNISTFEKIFYNLTGINYEIIFKLADKKNIEEKTNVDNYEDINNYELWQTNLNPNLNFDNFIVGESNNFAKTAAMHVAQNPGTIYNPLFIYGRSGIGKTHLMHAIGNYIVKNTKLKVLYTTSEEFMNDYTGISYTNSEDKFNYVNNFKNKYRNIDVLIIDDIQYLVGAEKTQQEFFNTFNTLHQANKQIIISSDRSPEDFKKLEDRLKSRFSWGLPVDIYPPDFDLRCRIIKSKIERYNIPINIDNDVIEYIANISQTDVRSLEGAINRLFAYTTMTLAKNINLEIAKEALGDYSSKDIYNVTDINHIQKVVAEYYGITVEMLKGKKRTINIAFPRQVAMYLCRMLTEESFIKIGLEFGARDHSTVMHNFEKIQEDLKTDEKLQEDVKNIKAKM